MFVTTKKRKQKRRAQAEAQGGEPQAPESAQTEAKADNGNPGQVENPDKA